MSKKVALENSNTAPQMRPATNKKQETPLKMTNALIPNNAQDDLDERNLLREEGASVNKVLKKQSKSPISLSAQGGKNLVNIQSRNPKDFPSKTILPVKGGMKKTKMSSVKVTTSAPVSPVKVGPTKRTPKVASLATSKPNTMNIERVASMSRVDIKKTMTDRLKTKSPWYDSIMSPITGGGVKIPDPIGTNTGTYQHVENVSVPVNTHGVSGLRIVCPYVNYFGGGAGQGINYQTTIGPSDTPDLQWGNPNGTAGFPFFNVPALMRATSAQHRVVSCAVVAQSEVSTLSDAGEMVAFVTPFRCWPITTSYETYQKQWDSAILPINTHKPLISRWYPLESETYLFNGTEQDEAYDPQFISYRDFLDPNFGEDGAIIPWEVGVVCSGMAPSIGTIRYQIIVNYEFIPRSSSAMVATDPSPVDPMEEQLVSSWISKEPVTSIASQKVASSAPMDSAVPEEPSGFGMLFNVFEEALPLIAKGLSFL